QVKTEPAGPRTGPLLLREEPHVIERESREVPGVERLEDLTRLRSLDREQSDRSVVPADRRVRPSVLAEDLLDLVRPARVRYDDERAGELIARIDPADEQVVHDEARRLEQERVADLLGNERGDVRGRASTEEVRGVGALDRHDPHVGYVEDPDPLPDR